MIESIRTSDDDALYKVFLRFVLGVRTLSPHNCMFHVALTLQCTPAHGPTLQSFSVRVAGTPSRTVPRLRLLAALVNFLRVRLREHAGSGPRRRLPKNG